MTRRPKLIFVAPGDIGKARVEPISWMKTCRGFATRGFEVTLLTLRVRRPDAVSRDAVWDHFNVEPVFRARVLPTLLTSSSGRRAFRLWALLWSGLTALAVIAAQLTRPRRLIVYARLPVLLAPFAVLSRALPVVRRPRLVYET